MTLSVANIPNASPRLWAPWVYSVFFYFYVLRLFTIEWKYFTYLRLNYLVRGDYDGNEPNSVRALALEREATRSEPLKTRTAGVCGWGGGVHACYTHPNMRMDEWETEPRPYRGTRGGSNMQSVLDLEERRTAKASC